MVGEGVVHECIKHPMVESILLINRKPSGIQHAKITEIVHQDFYDLTSIAPRLSGYDGCLFCLGVSSVGLSEAEYTRISYDLTLHMGTVLSRMNPDMVFCYVSGSGTDSSEQGRSMWARVKGRTENALMKLQFRAAYMFRPGYLHPTLGLKNTHRYYAALSWMYPVLRRLLPRHVLSLKELGLAMIHSVIYGSPKPVLESKDIAELAKR